MKQVIWIRIFKCSSCGKPHKAEGRRMSLDKIQANIEKDCENGEQIKIVKSGFIK